MVRSRWGQEAPASVKDQPLALSSQPALARTLDQERGPTRARKRLWGGRSLVRPGPVSSARHQLCRPGAQQTSSLGQVRQVTRGPVSQLYMNVATVDVGMDR